VGGVHPPRVIVTRRLARDGLPRQSPWSPPATRGTLRRVCALGCEFPLMQAPLGRGAATHLATEVSQAGGLGTLGASWTEPPVLREQIRTIARVTDRPFCVNLVLDFAQDERLEVVVEERVRWVSFSFGLRPELFRLARAGGSRVLVQVASADGARAAADAGADALIVQGVEAGGHVESVVGLLPLLAEVRRAVSLPLLAAGGIADPASALAALAAGASAVVMGTRFVASDECDAHPRYKARLLAAEGRDTVLTELFDIGWSAPHRVLRNSTYERWRAAGRPPPGQRPGEGEIVAEGIPRYALNMPLSGTDGDVEAMAMYAGQGVGTIDTVEPAAAIVERFAAALRSA
jgi:nitronate monooxygenase